jgi:hypothetical protein
LISAYTNATQLIPELFRVIVAHHHTVGRSKCFGQTGVGTAGGIRIRLHRLAFLKARIFKGLRPGADRELNRPQGGPLIGGIEALVSDQLPANRIVAVVADGLIVASDDTIALDASRQALIQLDSSPDSPPTSSTNLISLWQATLVGLRAERAFAFKVARTRSVAALSF